MSDSSALPKSCPKCGIDLPSEATEGLCPRCLMAEAMQPSPPGAEAVPDPEAATIVSSRPRPTLSGSNQPDLPLPEELDRSCSRMGTTPWMAFSARAAWGRCTKARRCGCSALLPSRSCAVIRARTTASRSASAVRRWRWRKLNHPNIVNVIDYGEAGPDYLYIVMEFVDGTDLVGVIRSGADDAGDGAQAAAADL
jgi:hypothetical protein